MIYMYNRTNNTPLRTFKKKKSDTTMDFLTITGLPCKGTQILVNAHPIPLHGTGSLQSDSKLQ